MSSSPIIVSRSTRFAVLVACGLAFFVAASGGSPAASARALRAQGRVVDETGTGKGDWPVSLIATQRFVELKRFHSGGEVTVVAQTRTDAQGYFRFDLERARGYHYWFLRFTDPSHLDPVVWLPTADIEITRDAKRDRPASVDVRVRHHPDWPEVERQIVQAGGEATSRGKILRTLGLPEKDSLDPVTGDQEWWYFTKGVMYTLRGGIPSGLHRFDPVLPPPAVHADGRS